MPGAKPNLTLPMIVAGVLVIAVAVAVFLYLRSGGLPSSEPPAAPAIENTDLGSEVYERTTNPVRGQLPGTVAPIPNPLENLYQNPFE